MSQNKEAGKLLSFTDKKILSVVSAAAFFPVYAPEVRNWKAKLRGLSSRGKPIEFSKEDLKNIYTGVKKFEREMLLFLLENEK